MRSSTRAFACAQPPRPASDNWQVTEPWARALVAQPTETVAADYGCTPGEATRVKNIVADLLRQEAAR
jgi:hypothetical protein